MLEQVVGKLRHRKLVRRLSEVDRLIGSNVEIVETSKPNAVSLLCKNLHLAGLVHRQQPFNRVSNDQIPRRIKRQTERASTSICEDARLRAEIGRASCRER